MRSSSASKEWAWRKWSIGSVDAESKMAKEGRSSHSGDGETGGVNKTSCTDDHHSRHWWREAMSMSHNGVDGRSIVEKVFLAKLSEE